MNGVYVFSKNTAVRNAPWWDKLYIAEELRHPLDLINDDVSFELREIGFGILLGD